jgi:hypothetical protein
MGNENSGGGGGGGSDNSSSGGSNNYSVPGQSGGSNSCPVAQQFANDMCDRVGSNEGLGKATPGGDISDGIRCLQAQKEADKACGK